MLVFGFDLMETLDFNGKEILLWRRKLLLKGGRFVDLDWLLDIEGGLNWSSLQQIRIDPSRALRMQKSLNYLADVWEEHLENQIPLQYLVRRCPWRDFELEVSPAVLIPRQETELLVDLALEKFDCRFTGCWADLGTGSGALGIALARSLPRATGHVVDCSKEALKLAEKNLNMLVPQGKVTLHLGNWWEPLRPWWGSIGLVVANPPYIPASVMAELEPIVRDHEPHIALCGGVDGLFACREIIRDAFAAISRGGWLILEHHHDQSDAVLKLLTQSGFTEVAFKNDLAGIKRFALGQRP